MRDENTMYFLRVFLSGVENYATEGIFFPSGEAAAIEAMKFSAKILHDMQDNRRSRLAYGRA